MNEEEEDENKGIFFCWEMKKRIKETLTIFSVSFFFLDVN
jgi:hypothetical protein